MPTQIHARYLAIPCLLYIMVTIVITPIYNFCEAYFAAPNINLSVIRFLLLCLFAFILIVLSVNTRTPFQPNPILLYSSLFPVLCFVYISSVFLVSFSSMLSYAKNADLIFLSRVDTVISGYWILYFAGLLLIPYKLYKILYACWVGIVAFIFINVDYLIRSFFYYEISVDEGYINYILMGDSFAFLSLLCLPFLKNKLLRWLSWMLAFIVLFFIPSRSAFFCFILAFIAINLYRLNSKRLLILFFLLLGSYYMISTSEIQNIINSNVYLSTSRIVNTSLVEDTSLKERLNMANSNFESFQNSWFSGDFMGDVRNFSGVDGNYTHNYFSLWEQFGLIPFLLFFFTMIIALFYYYYLFKRMNDIDIGTMDMITAIFVFTFLSIIVARSFNFAYIWFSIATIFAAYSKLKTKGSLMN